jgi:hypothetical protein
MEVQRDFPFAQASTIPRNASFAGFPQVADSRQALQASRVANLLISFEKIAIKLA